MFRVDPQLRFRPPDVKVQMLHGEVTIPGEVLGNPVALSRYYEAECEHVVDSDLPDEDKARRLVGATMIVEQANPACALEFLQVAQFLDSRVRVRGRIRALQARLKKGR